MHRVLIAHQHNAHISHPFPITPCILGSFAIPETISVTLATDYLCVSGVYCFTAQDDHCSMDFVAAAANLRAIAFGISQKSRFDIKCELI